MTGWHPAVSPQTDQAVRLFLTKAETAVIDHADLEMMVQEALNWARR
jgi:hypothetical protein